MLLLLLLLFVLKTCWISWLKEVVKSVQEKSWPSLKLKNVASLFQVLETDVKIIQLVFIIVTAALWFFFTTRCKNTHGYTQIDYTWFTNTCDGSGGGGGCFTLVALRPFIISCIFKCKFVESVVIDHNVCGCCLWKQVYSRGRKIGYLVTVSNLYNLYTTHSKKTCMRKSEHEYIF